MPFGHRGFREKGRWIVRGLVVYDSYYGNTKLVAEAIARELEAKGHESELRNVRDKYSTPPQGDILFLGSPVRMGSTTKRVKKYAEKLDKSLWSEKPLVVFTTILALPEDPKPEQVESRDKYDTTAGRKLADHAREEGLNALEEQLCVDVQGLRGPLVEEGLEQTRQFTRQILRGL